MIEACIHADTHVAGSALVNMRESAFAHLMTMSSSDAWMRKNRRLDRKIPQNHYAENTRCVGRYCRTSPMTGLNRSHSLCLFFAGCLIASATVACGGKQDKAADKKVADTNSDKKAEAEPAEKPEPQTPKTLEPGKVELPWTFERVSVSLPPGTEINYKLSGKDAKGKDVADTFSCKIKKISKQDVTTVCNTVDTPSKDKGAGMPATRDWTKYSPLFAVERPEHELLKREKITVPAGEFDCVSANLNGFFGARYTVWMIVDQPGVYAKVIEMPNASAEGDKTEKVYELIELKLAE